MKKLYCYELIKSKEFNCKWFLIENVILFVLFPDEIWLTVLAMQKTKMHN